MFDAIAKAREYVLVESFIFEEAASGDRTLSTVLIAAAARGVHVYVLYDAMGSLTTDEQFLGRTGRGRHWPVRVQSTQSVRGTLRRPQSA